MTNATTTNNRFEIDFINKTICGTKTSFKKASKGFGPEYKELVAKMTAHPNFVCVEKEQKNHSNKVKETYSKLTFKFMEDYITYVVKMDDGMTKYTNVKKFAKESKMSVYPFVKKWFLSEFSNNGVFDMNEAEEKITEAKISEAAAVKIIELNTAVNTADSQIA